MAWYKCIGSSGGGSGDISEIIRITEAEASIIKDGYTYSIETTSTSGSLAKILVKEYLNETEIQSVEIEHNDPSTFTTFNDIYVSYNSNITSWEVVANSGKAFVLDGILYENNVLSWGCNYTVNYFPIIGGTITQTPDFDSDKIYLVTNVNGDMVRKQYQGIKRILRKEDISDYEFYYEDLYFPASLDVQSSVYNSARNYAIDTGIELFSNENYQKSFELVFKINPHLSQSYRNIFAKNNYTTPTFQVYCSKDNKVGIAYGSDHIYNDCVDKDIKIIVDRTNNEYKFYADNVLIDTQNIQQSWTESNNSSLIGLYGVYSPYNGFIEYIGFKWLTSPTPSGADGLSYDIEIDGNWDMIVTEYNNGVQSDQETFDIDTVISTPATFGDLIITGTSSDDQYIVKPNSADGKSIKYNDVIYSGDDIIIQQPAYSTDTITGLLGWIE